MRKALKYIEPLKVAVEYAELLTDAFAFVAALGSILVVGTAVNVLVFAAPLLYILLGFTISSLVVPEFVLCSTAILLISSLPLIVVRAIFAEHQHRLLFRDMVIFTNTVSLVSFLLWAGMFGMADSLWVLLVAGILSLASWLPILALTKVLVFGAKGK